MRLAKGGAQKYQPVVNEAVEGREDDEDGGGNDDGADRPEPVGHALLRNDDLLSDHRWWRRRPRNVVGPVILGRNVLETWPVSGGVLHGEIFY